MGVVTVFRRIPLYIKADKVEPGDKISWVTKAPLGHQTAFIPTYAEVDYIGEESEKTDRKGVDYGYIRLYGKFFSIFTNDWSKTTKSYDIPRDLDVLVIERKIDEKMGA